MTEVESDVHVAVLTVSDRAFNGTYEDRGGPTVVKYVQEHFNGDIQFEKKVIPDDLGLIKESIEKLADTCCLVLTTGGTGPAPRDVTPEATTAACKKMLPGFGELMRNISVAKVPTAILSRQTAGICGQALVVNLPGSPKAIAECMDPVLQAIPHAVRLAGSTQKLKIRPEYHVKGRMCNECSVAH